jgi:hypothetical protein
MPPTLPSLLLQRPLRLEHPLMELLPLQLVTSTLKLLITHH